MRFDRRVRSVLAAEIALLFLTGIIACALVPSVAAAPPASYDFSFVWMTDTQYYSESHPAIYDGMTQWIANNRDGMKIRYVIHTGDIVETAANVTHWQNADHSMSILDDANVPYGVLAGNHEGHDGFLNYRQHFGSWRFQAKPYYHDFGDGTNENHYDLITSNGVKFVIVCLSFGYIPNANPWLLGTPLVINSTERAWASSIFQSHSDRIGILAVHEYINTGGAYPQESWGNDGSNLYNDVVAPNSNVWLVLCGHIGGARLNTKTVGSRTFYELLSDYQSLTNGGNGYQKIFYFDIAHNNAHVMTYSALLNQYGGTGYPFDEFDLTLPQQSPPAPTLTVTGAFHGARLAWTGVGAAGYNLYYSRVNDPNGATQYATDLAGTAYDVTGLPSDTWGKTCYFWVAPVDSGGVVAPTASWGMSSDTVWIYKIEITSVSLTENLPGSLQVRVEYRSRYLGSEGITVGVQIGEYLGPGTPSDVPNREISIVTTHPIALPSLMSTGVFNFGSTSSEFVSGSSYKAWIMLWNQLPGDPGYWEPYAAKMEKIPITIA